MYVFAICMMCVIPCGLIMLQKTHTSQIVLGRMLLFKKKNQVSLMLGSSFRMKSNHYNQAYCLTVEKVISVFPVPFSTVPPVPNLLVVREMIKRLQELRHTEQVQRAYALNCGEGATVSYEIQIRVLREFGLSDAAAELLQVRTIAVQDHKYFDSVLLMN